MDRSVALSHMGGDEALLLEIAALFLEEYPELLARLAAAVSGHDAQTVERAAHSIKGSVANFGAQSAFQAALALEQMGRAERLVDASEQLRALERALASLHTELEAL